jgi:excisionase family DNA binding protein
MLKSPSPDDWLSPKECAAIVRVNERTIRRWVACGYLPGFKQEKTIRVKRSLLEAFLSRREAGDA